jgi:tRNA uridine 5-carboxymethylaminomethyl modification enzyme
MFTSRAEFRILLRQDNADIRLTELGYKIGLASEERYSNLQQKMTNISKSIELFSSMKFQPEEINSTLLEIGSSPVSEKVSVMTLLKRPEISISVLSEANDKIKSACFPFSKEELEQTEIKIKYEPYLDREEKLAAKLESLENYKINSDFDYDRVKALSSEAREKLKKVRPETIGQMSRISGVSPADVSVLSVYLGK